MIKKRLNWSMLAMVVVALAIGSTGCKKSKENAEINGQSAKDFANDMEAYNDLMIMALDIVENDPNVSLKKSNASKFLNDEITIKYDQKDSSLSDGNGLLMLIDYGYFNRDDFTATFDKAPRCGDGLRRSGAIGFYVSADYKKKGGRLVIHFDPSGGYFSYYHGSFVWGKNSSNVLGVSGDALGRSYDGKFFVTPHITLTNDGNGGWDWEAGQYSSGNYNKVHRVHNDENARTTLLGSGNLKLVKDSEGNITRMELSGDSEGENSLSFAYSSKITTSLVKDLVSCPDVNIFTSGVIELTNDLSDNKPLKIDFGSGECDNKADVSQKINAVYTYKETIEF